MTHGSIQRFPPLHTRYNLSTLSAIWIECTSQRSRTDDARASLPAVLAQYRACALLCAASGVVAAEWGRKNQSVTRQSRGEG
eukprot:6207381-Pleurochrysis_carterae.AAC.2